MNKSDLQEIYKLEEQLQLLQSDLNRINRKVPELVALKDSIDQLNDKYERNSKDIWTFINTITKELRDEEKLK